MNKLQNKDIVILIVDDEATSCLILAEMLRREGYKTIEAGTVARGQALAESRLPEIILLDVFLPDGQGPDLCRRLKAQPSTSEIPVLFISSDATVDRKVECFDAGGVDYITKPYQAREVLARLRTHLRLREANKRIAEMTAAQIRDLNRAQKAILPPDPADFPEAKFSAFYRQLSGAGGDFYEIVKLEEKLFDYITFDVCGHDVGGSMVTAALKALFAQNCSILHSPAEILSIVNKAIPSVLQRNQFVAVSWVRLNRNTGKAHIVNSGQPAVIVVSGDGAIDVIDPTGDLIGVFDSAVFETVEKMVKPGDRFLLYSDGLIELGDKTPASRDAKSAKLVQRCRASAGTALPTFVDEIKKVMFGNAEPDDDVVILCFDV